MSRKLRLDIPAGIDPTSPEFVSLLNDRLRRLGDPGTAGGTTTNSVTINQPVQVRSLRSYGAVGDGIADDTAALQAAFDDTSHLDLFVPAGNYLLTAEAIKDLTDENGFFMYGLGEESRFILGNKNARIQMYGAPVGTTHDSHLLLKSFSIGCASANGSQAAALYMNKCALWGIEDVRISAIGGYRSWSRVASTLTAIVVSSGVATAQTSTAHNVNVGDAIFVHAGATANLNDAYIVTTVGDSTHFSFHTYADFPVSNGTYNDTNLIVSIGRVQTCIKLAGSQKGHIYGGSLEAAAYGVQVLRQDGIGSNMVNISKCVNFSDNYMTPCWFNGCDDGLFQGNHTTQGRYSMLVSETGSGGVTIIGNHFEYMTKYGFYQDGGRASVMCNVFYNDVGTVTAYVPTASNIRFFFNQCNKTIRFGEDGGTITAGVGVYQGVCAFNTLGAGETYEGTMLHFSNLHFSGAGPSSDAVMRLKEPAYEWAYTPVIGDAMPLGPIWTFQNSPTIPGKYEIALRGAGPGTGYTFTAVAATDVITATGHDIREGEAVTVSSGGTLPGGLDSLRVYYVRDVATNTLKLAVSRGGAVVDITSTGTGTHTIRADHGAGILSNQAGELFIPTSNNRFRFALPDVVGLEVGSRICGVIDSNGMQLPFGGTGVTSTAKGHLLVGTSSTTRANLAPSSDGKVLTTNSAAADGTGLEWAAIAATLAGDVTGALGANTVATVGGASAANVATATAAANAATSANTASTIVKRDGSGGITVGAVDAASLTLGTDLPVTEGGTGASTAAAARTNLSAVTRTSLAAVTGTAGGSYGSTEQTLLNDLKAKVNAILTALNA
jgi:hypothetical protein